MDRPAFLNIRGAQPLHALNIQSGDLSPVLAIPGKWIMDWRDAHVRQT